MPDPTDDLLRLWARRDTEPAPEEAGNRVLLVFKDGDEPGAPWPGVRFESTSPVPETLSQKIVSETIPAPSVTLFPTVRIALPSINLATYHHARPSER